MGEEAELVLPPPKRFRPALVRAEEGWTLREIADVAGASGAAALAPLLRADGKHNVSRGKLDDLQKRMEAKRTAAAAHEAKAQAAERVAAEGRVALEAALSVGRLAAPGGGAAGAAATAATDGGGGSVLERGKKERDRDGSEDEGSGKEEDTSASASASESESESEEED